MIQLLVYLLLAAGIGFSLGWLVRAGRAGPEREFGEADWRARLQASEGERERLAVELSDSDRTRGELQVALDRLRDEKAELLRRREESAGPAAAEGSPANGDGAGTPPERLEGPQGEADDLKRINGIGPSIEKTLNGLGIYHFRQIAAFTPGNVAWLDRHLPFKGRIEREDWIGQAGALSRGGGTGLGVQEERRA